LNKFLRENLTAKTPGRQVKFEEFSLDHVREAQELIRPILHRTPLFTSRFLSEQTGAEIWLKAELFQKTGSFKPRGAINRLKHFTDEEKKKGIVTVSAGNHAQAVAFAASREKIPCTVVMPASAPANKLEATRDYGATVILHDEMSTIFERTEEVRREKDAILLHPFNDPYVIAGQGTVGLEIFEDLPQADVVVAGIGGGALASGIAFALKNLNPRVRMIGVEPEGAPTMTRALEAGKPVRLEKMSSIADGLSAPIVGEWTLAMVQKYVDEILLVKDSEIIDAIQLLLQRAKLLVEPAGAAGTAALITGKLGDVKGKKVVLVLSGGNLSLELLKSWL
jgi:threonine dehydratase